MFDEELPFAGRRLLTGSPNGISFSYKKGGCQHINPVAAPPRSYVVSSKAGMIRCRTVRRWYRRG